MNIHEHICPKEYNSATRNPPKMMLQVPIKDSKCFVPNAVRFSSANMSQIAAVWSSHHCIYRISCL